MVEDLVISYNKNPAYKLEDEMSKIGEKLGNFVFLYRSLDGDMTNSDTYMAVVTQLTSLVDQLEKELKAQGRI